MKHPNNKLNWIYNSMDQISDSESFEPSRQNSINGLHQDSTEESPGANRYKGAKLNNLTQITDTGKMKVQNTNLANQPILEAKEMIEGGLFTP